MSTRGAPRPPSGSAWPAGRARDGGIDRVPLPIDTGALWLCGKHVVGPDPWAAMERVGADAIVCLTEAHELDDRYPDYVAWLRDARHGRAAWFPVPDLHAPPVAEAMAILDAVTARLLVGEHVVLHCAAGIGRAGTIAVGVLMMLGVDRDEAIGRVAAARPMAGPEVGAQIELVDALAVLLASGWTVRDGRPDDVAAITELFNALLATTTIEYTETPHTPEGRRRWMDERAARGFPVIVAVDDDDRVVGVASYGDFRDSVARPGYAGTVEHTVHVDRAWWGRGVGAGLLGDLVTRARAAGVHVMIGAVDADHTDSLAFHARLGFVEVGRLPEVGRKFGRWLDLVLVQRIL